MGAHNELKRQNANKMENPLDFGRKMREIRKGMGARRSKISVTAQRPGTSVVKLLPAVGDELPVFLLKFGHNKEIVERVPLLCPKLNGCRFSVQNNDPI